MNSRFNYKSTIVFLIGQIFMYFCNTIMKLRAVIERITYQNGENGYSILKARVKGYDDLVTLGACR